MINTSGNLNSLGLVLHAMITTVFCTTSWAGSIVFSHEWILDNELFPLSEEKTFPMKEHFILSYSLSEGKAKKKLN